MSMADAKRIQRYLEDAYRGSAMAAKLLNENGHEFAPAAEGIRDEVLQLRIDFQRKTKRDERGSVSWEG